jgi:hypothetical protein
MGAPIMDLQGIKTGHPFTAVQSPPEFRSKSIRPGGDKESAQIHVVMNNVMKRIVVEE